jgi:hypothetical protein
MGWEKVMQGTYSKTDTAVQQRIRSLASKRKVTARRRNGKWYFADAKDNLRSPQTGMNDEQALAWFKEQG